MITSIADKTWPDATRISGAPETIRKFVLRGNDGVTVHCGFGSAPASSKDSSAQELPPGKKQ